MDSITALLYANVAIWLGVGLYLFILIKKQTQIQKSLKSIDLDKD